MTPADQEEILQRPARPRAALVVFLVAVAAGIALVAWLLVPANTDGPSFDEVPTLPGWELVWHDEFDGDELTDQWEVEDSSYGSGNAELQCYKPDRVTVAGGALRLTAEPGDVTCGDGQAREYSSGMVRSRRDWTYGAVELRVSVPEGRGFLPAGWMLSRNRPYGRDGLSGEIDLFEVNTESTNQTVTSVHWTRTGCGGGCDKAAALTELPADSPATEFHDYRMEWTPERLEFWVDGEGVLTLDGSPGNGWSSAAPNPSVDSLYFPAPFDASNEMYLLLNLAVGGNWPGAPGPETPFPATMEVDWVRVFRQSE